MFVRVAFAAAISVDPDILIIDEVLAVGDARFQQKCFRKFEEFKQKGKTILLVTHNPDMVARHCNRAIVLDRGRIIIDADPNQAINAYYGVLFPTNSITRRDVTEKPSNRRPVEDSGSVPPGLFDLGSPEDQLYARPNYNPGEDRLGNGAARILDAAVVAGSQTNVTSVVSGEKIHVYLRVWFKERFLKAFYALNLRTVDGVIVSGIIHPPTPHQVTPTEPGDEIVVRISLIMRLQSGDFFIDLGVGSRDDGELTHLDARFSVLHLTINGSVGFHGLANLDAEFSEVRVGPIIESIDH
jgi:lipopolysaccharide transport system ATP-binding protein